MPNIPLADPSFRLKAKIDLLLGIDVIPAVTLSGIQTEVCGSLMDQETRSGWIISGPLQGIPVSSCAAFTTRVAVSRGEALETLLTKFWEVEDLPGKPVEDSDSVCEVNFQKITRRDVSGRYTVSLPFRDPTNINLGHSRPGALAQFLRNEGRLLKNIPAKTEYDAVIQEYLDLGHMRQVPFDGIFNASSKSTNGVSLNDILYPGPVLQSDLTTQILKWRFFRVVFNADITKMYRQIMVDPIHTPFQRILFRNKEGQLGDYELNTVTFGINCAPFLAIRVLQQLASDVQYKFPLASDIIKSYMYVDDVLAGAHNEATAIAMVNELQDALGSAGFPLRKWTSNVKSVLSCIPKSHLLNADFLDIEEASTAKTLGIRWNATTDEFYFVISPQDVKSAYTKREVLGQIAKLFDPAGWLAPFVIQAKVFMQELWLQELGKCRKLPNDYSGEVTSSEINQVLQALIRVTQRDYFPTEHRCLQQKKSLATSSTILNLNPFIDASGVIRACGRVQQAAALSYDERNPILLPVISPLSRLLVLFTHQISLHGGSQLVVRLIRQRYWIPRLRNLVKSVVNSCKVCVIYKRRLQSQLMGTLPSERTTFARPFTTTGIDFAGPFDLQSFTGLACRISKGYVCIQSASKRFLKVYPAENLIPPPGAPHMGGLWEAGAKSFKTLFYKATSNQKYTFEEFSTLLAKVEACLNSRPISPMSEDPTDSLALTPGHFLVGGPLLSVTEPEIKDQVPSIINRWQRLKAVSQRFCTRWKDEYLKELHKRNKWRFPSTNLEVGDLVVLKDDNLPFNEWRLGRIHQAYPGSDGNVRVVELRTARGIVKRPVAKLIFLPPEERIQTYYVKLQ
ncbi:uncharacterized protein [Drosophila tropicalis]|uniref:uncharacterized protein n=1 Tax=Drosophila tropicalis TaxID=46794 RepID=UPI0035AC2727